jgi:hypothetical protein
MSTIGRSLQLVPRSLRAGTQLLPARRHQRRAGRILRRIAAHTIDNSIAVHPEFETAVKDGRIVADARVARGLYAGAVGYDRKVEREILHQGELRTITNVTHYPPNPQACIFWLRNRRRRTWREGPNDPSSTPIDDIALLDAAGESVRHAVDSAQHVHRLRKLRKLVSAGPITAPAEGRWALRCCPRHAPLLESLRGYKEGT